MNIDYRTPELDYHTIESYAPKSLFMAIKEERASLTRKLDNGHPVKFLLLHDIETPEDDTCMIFSFRHSPSGVYDAANQHSFFANAEKIGYKGFGTIRGTDNIQMDVWQADTNDIKNTIDDMRMSLERFLQGIKR